jgi:hypothetical protein
MQGDSQHVEFWTHFGLCVPVCKTTCRCTHVYTNMHNTDGNMHHARQVRAGDSGGTKDGGIDSTVGDAQVLVLSILPLPVVNKVRPRMGHVSGGTGITVFGEHFGSEYSRGYTASQYQGVAVYIGEQRCIGERIISDGAILCTVPAGVGTSDVTVNISDAGQTRGGRLREGYDHSVIYYGGSLTDTKTEYTGYVGMGPRAIVSVATSPFVDASMQVASPLNLSTST